MEKELQMDVLKEIIAYKKELVAHESRTHSISNLKSSKYFGKKVFSTKDRLISQNQHGVIAEFKRKSPSKGLINEKLDIKEVVTGYQNAGASAVSVLTDSKYFGGSSYDFQMAREVLDIPLLRKDFIVDEYQVYQTKSMGADLMLLIAAALTREEQLNLAQKAKKLGLEVLLEIHSKDEILEDVLEYIDIIGVNNRNLKTFKTSIENSIKLARIIPENIPKISESGISSIKDIKVLSNVGYNGFLIGEQFMKCDRPGQELSKFLKT